MELKWYAVYTKPRWEKKVAEILTRRKILNYCPLNRVMRQWHDRKKVIMEPLFSSYVFVNIIERQLVELRNVDGIINVLYWLGKPAIIKDCEIDIIKSFLNEYENIKLEKVTLSVNDNVRVIHGPLESREGSVVEVLNNTVKVLLPSLGYSMLAQIPYSHIEKVSAGTVSQLSNNLSMINT